MAEDSLSARVILPGDHDPSGIDMTRDIRDRLQLFMGEIEVQRLALNMDQVDQYNPLPNPTRERDARLTGFLRLFGDKALELDALEPTVISALFEAAVTSVRDEERWEKALEEEQDHKRRLGLVTSNWHDLATYVDEAT